MSNNAPRLTTDFLTLKALIELIPDLLQRVVVIDTDGDRVVMLNFGEAPGQVMVRTVVGRERLRSLTDPVALTR